MKKFDLIIFDWAGTIVDFGSIIPEIALEDSFKKFNVNCTKEEVRRFMGTNKRDHIKSVLSLPNIKSEMGISSDNVLDEFTDKIYEFFKLILLERLSSSSTFIDGAEETIGKLKNLGIKTGSTTGYNSEMMEKLIAGLGKDAIIPDINVSSSDVSQGRPSPEMINLVMEKANVNDKSKVLMVGDTTVDMETGKNAGVYTVGVVIGGSLLGLSIEEIKTMEPNLLEEKIKNTKESYISHGADKVIDNINDLLELI